MRIGLIDVDGHRFPNLALMRISSYYKERGDAVEWYQPSLFGTWYDIVYMSKVFSDAYSPDEPEPMNAGTVIKGGTGYAISLVNGKEVYDKSKDPTLPPEIEKCFPDYSLYPEYDFAVAMTSRGCPRGCGFCHVGAKEGRCSVKVADVSDFYNGQKEIRVLDPNITACKEKLDLFHQYLETGAWIDFSQGLDIRLIEEADIELLNRMKIRRLHFAWDNPKDSLEEKFRLFSQKSVIKDRRRKAVYVLTNFNSTMEENLHRIYTLRDLDYDPYVMIYDKPHAPHEIIQLQYWCNSKIMFRTVRDFNDFDPRTMRKSDPDNISLFEQWEVSNGTC